MKTLLIISPSPHYIVYNNIKTGREKERCLFVLFDGFNTCHLQIWLSTFLTLYPWFSQQWNVKWNIYYINCNKYISIYTFCSKLWSKLRNSSPKKCDALFMTNCGCVLKGPSKPNQSFFFPLWYRKQIWRVCVCVRV